ncbi:hypothetical protein [Bacillus cereus group sp. BfR-BA-01328]|uniref:hypothetical protein n=1 Tax=Bacillus cereus group sp. BfR-BA-01328 TaxID=2920304 RepID=UPI001F5AFEBA
MLGDDFVEVMFFGGLAIALMIPISFMVLVFQLIYEENIFYFYITLSSLISFIAGVMYGIYKKEYNRIKTNDFNRIKEEIKKHIRSFYPEETFFLIDEKEVSKREILKRCFCTYELSIHVFAHHGELVYQVKVNKNEVWLKDFKQVSNVNFAKEFYKK